MDLPGLTHDDGTCMNRCGSVNVQSGSMHVQKNAYLKPIGAYQHTFMFLLIQTHKTEKM